MRSDQFKHAGVVLLEKNSVSSALAKAGLKGYDYVFKALVKEFYLSHNAKVTTIARTDDTQWQKIISQIISNKSSLLYFSEGQPFVMSRGPTISSSAISNRVTLHKIDPDGTTSYEGSVLSDIIPQYIPDNVTKMFLISRADQSVYDKLEQRKGNTDDIFSASRKLAGPYIAKKLQPIFNKIINQVVEELENTAVYLARKGKYRMSFNFTRLIENILTDPEKTAQLLQGAAEDAAKYLYGPRVDASNPNNVNSLVDDLVKKGRIKKIALIIDFFKKRIFQGIERIHESKRTSSNLIESQSLANLIPGRRVRNNLFRQISSNPVNGVYLTLPKKLQPLPITTYEELIKQSQDTNSNLFVVGKRKHVLVIPTQNGVETIVFDATSGNKLTQGYGNIWGEGRLGDFQAVFKLPVVTARQNFNLTNRFQRRASAHRFDGYPFIEQFVALYPGSVTKIRDEAENTLRALVFQLFANKNYSLAKKYLRKLDRLSLMKLEGNNIQNSAGYYQYSKEALENAAKYLINKDKKEYYSDLDLGETELKIKKRILNKEVPARNLFLHFFKHELLKYEML